MGVKPCPIVACSMRQKYFGSQTWNSDSSFLEKLPAL